MTLTNTNSLILLQATKTLGIAAQILNLSQGKIRLTKGKKSHIVHKLGFNLNSHQAIISTRNKLKTLTLLRRHGLPIPRPSHRFPVAAKPISGQKGQHVYLNIQNRSQLRTALKNISAPALIQPFILGHDLRFFVLAGKVIGIVHRRPPQLNGDGRSTIKQLIDAENRRRVRLTKTSGRRLLNRLHNWPRLKWYLDLQAILPKNKTIEVYPLSNFSTGGSAHALTKNQVHPLLIKLAERAVALTGLTVAGVDMIVKDWAKPIKNNAYVLEVNSDPSLRLHAWPNTGKPQPVATQLLRYIFAIQTAGTNS
jgi:cyanophycin synthetase